MPRPYSKRKDGPRKEIDDKVGEPQWRLVYEAYASSGDPKVIGEAVNISPEHVKHILKYGVARLGLPAISSHAVDKAEIALRLQESGLSWDDTAENANRNLDQPKVQDAIQNRVAKEAMAAQTLLNSGLSAAESFAKLLSKVKSKIDAGLLSMPDEIDLGYLNKIALTMEKLSKAVDIATRLTRLTAGEPETHVLHHVTGLIGMLSPDEIREFASTGELPRSLRGRVSSTVIDVVPDSGSHDSDD